MRIYLLLFGLLACLFACAPPPVSRAPLPAPAPIAQLRVHVHNADRERAEREENVNLYTIFLRQAVERAFVRAGYRVVVDPNLPYDVLAKVSLGDFTISQRVEAEASASMTLWAGDRVVDQLAAIIIRNEDADISQASPIALVDAVTRSRRVAEFAESGRAVAPTAPEPRKPAVIAEPASPP